MKSLLRVIWILFLACTVQVSDAPAQEREGADSKETALERIRALHERLEFAPRDSFLNYAIATIARRKGIDLSREGIDFPIVPIVTEDPARRVDLMSLTTGAVALHESLQLTEILTLRRRQSGDMVPLANLGAPDLPSLDFEKRLNDAREAGLDCSADEEAHFIPHDWAYMRFESGRELMAFLKEADVWVHHILTFYGRSAQDAGVLAKPFQRLGLPDPLAHAALYETIPGPIAVTFSDLFLREGSDITLILPPGVPSFLVAEIPGDGRSGFARFKAEVKGRLVISSTKAALERVEQTVERNVGEPLAEQPDYLYMRGLLPAHEKETAFVFLSEAFLQRLVGPRLRVLESRRVRCASHLRTAINAALLFMEEEKRKPGSLDELFEQDYLNPERMTCPHSGTYTLNGGIEAVCTKHNRLGSLTPHLALELEKVFEEEAAAYRRFSRAYANYWRRFFDPVGVSIERDGPSWQIDFIALPLADNSMYRNLSSTSGGVPIQDGIGLRAPGTILHLAAKVDRSFLQDLDSWLEKTDLIPEEKARKTMYGAFGGSASIGLLDNRILFDFDLAGFLGEALEWNAAQDVLMAPVLSGASLPAYVTITLSDRAKAEAFLQALHRGLLLKSSRPEGGTFDLRLGVYALEGSEKEVHSLTLEFFAFKFRIFYTIHDTYLVVATRPDVLRKVVRDGRPETPLNPMNMKLSIVPGAWKAIRPDMLLDYEEAARKDCLHFLTGLRPFSDQGIENGESLLGAAMKCPDGGDYRAVPGGGLECSLHGRPAEPRQGAAPAVKNAVSRILDGLEEIEFNLCFIEEGIHSTIRFQNSKGTR
ncbi:MAG: hypothetical protein ACYTG7_08405 [Planctomycetota bacterium]|jgi:hypothetical protein